MLVYAISKDVLKMHKKLMIILLGILLILPINVVAKNHELQISNIIFADDVNGCSNSDSAILGDIKNPESTAWLLQKILNYIKIIGPTLALILGIIDFIQAIVSSDEENMKKVQVKFMKRIIAAILLFFIPIITTILLDVFGFISDGCGIS